MCIFKAAYSRVVGSFASNAGRFLASLDNNNRLSNNESKNVSKWQAGVKAGQVSLQCHHDFYAGIVQCQDKGTDSHMFSGSSIVFLSLHSSIFWGNVLGAIKSLEADHADEKPGTDISFMELQI